MVYIKYVSSIEQVCEARNLGIVMDGELFKSCLKCLYRTELWIQFYESLI